MTRTLLAVSLAVILAACGAPPATVEPFTPKPAVLHLRMENSTGATVHTFLQYETRSPEGPGPTGVLLRADPLGAGFSIGFPRAVSSTVGATVNLAAEAWAPEAPDARGRLALEYMLKHAEETCTVQVEQPAGQFALVLSCSGTK